MKCSNCGCPIEKHGDRAVWPACEGGTPPITWRDIAGICDCKGFTDE